MPRLQKAQLFERVIQAAYESGWNVLYLTSQGEHPFLLRFYKEDETSYLIRIYIWNITHGGGAARAQNEYRIQITGIEQFEQRQGEKTLILGYWDDIGVFAGFDFNKHSGRLGSSPSMQIREENLRSAYRYGFSPCDRGNGEIAIAFRSDFLVEYILNLESLHRIGESVGEIQIIERVTTGEIQLNGEEVTALPGPRQTVIDTITRRLRDNSFTNRVLTAYGNRCAFSGIQLKLVDAAHILPVSAGNSTDETCNGIALSALYHRAYDRGLVTFNSNYEILVNERKFQQLREIGFDGGLDTFRHNLRPMIILPPDTNEQPRALYIQYANELRGW